MHPWRDIAFLPRSSRRSFLAAGISGTFAVAGLSATAVCGRVKEEFSFDLSELSITDLQAGIKAGKYTSRSLVEKYLRGSRPSITRGQHSAA